VVGSVPALDKKGNVIKWFGTYRYTQNIKEKESGIKAKEHEESDRLKSAFLAIQRHNE
jgi:hypothetical protein